MPAVREIEAKLRAIRMAVKNAIDESTGKVDQVEAEKQKTELKKWIAGLEVAYIHEAKAKPSKAALINERGKDIRDKAWHCYELLTEFEMQAASPEPTMRQWEVLPSGLVRGGLKIQVLGELEIILQEFKKFRREVLQL